MPFDYRYNYKATVSKLLGTLIVPFSDAFTLPVDKNGNWPGEVSVVVKPAPPKGDGVFASEDIEAGTFVCRYHGKVLTTEEEVELYPKAYPDYCLQIGPNLSIDAQHSLHWSRLINHDQNGTLKLHTDEQQRVAFFTAQRDIAIDEELSFDYGISYFIFRYISPAEGTESRSLDMLEESLEHALAQEKPLAPTTRAEVAALLEGHEEGEDAIKAALMRGINFYGYVNWLDDGKSVELVSSLNGESSTFVYSEITIEQLAELIGKLYDESQTSRG